MAALLMLARVLECNADRTADSLVRVVRAGEDAFVRSIKPRCRGA